MSGWLPSICTRFCLKAEKLSDDRDTLTSESCNALPLLPRILPWPKNWDTNGTWSLVLRVLYTLLLLPCFSAIAFLRLQPTSGLDHLKGNSRIPVFGGWKLSREGDLGWHWTALLGAWTAAILGLPFAIAYGILAGSTHPAASNGFVWLWLCVLLLPPVTIAAYRSQGLAMPLALVWRGRGRARLWCPQRAMTGWRNWVSVLSLVVDMLQLSALAFANHGDDNPFWVLLLDWPGTFPYLLYVAFVLVYGWHLVLACVIALSTALAYREGDRVRRGKEPLVLNVQHLPLLCLGHPLVAELALVTIAYHLLRALACTPAAPPERALVLAAHPALTCWVGRQQVEGAVAMLGLSLFIPSAVLLSPLLRADVSLHALREDRPLKASDRRGSWLRRSEVPDHPEMQLRPTFSALERCIKFILVAFAVLLRGNPVAIPIVFFVFLLLRLVLGRLLLADSEALHIHRGPCYFAASNHPILFSYAAAFLAAPVSCAAFYLNWSQMWPKVSMMAVVWVGLALGFWWANYSYFRGVDERPRPRDGGVEMEGRTDTPLIKSDSTEHLDAPSDMMAGAIGDSAGSALPMGSPAGPRAASSIGASHRRPPPAENSDTSSGRSHGPTGGPTVSSGGTPLRRTEVAWEVERPASEALIRPPPPLLHLNKSAVPAEEERRPRSPPIIGDLPHRKDNPLTGLPPPRSPLSPHALPSALLAGASDMGAHGLPRRVAPQPEVIDMRRPPVLASGPPPDPQELDHRQLVQMQQQMMLDQLQRQHPNAGYSAPALPPQLHFNPHDVSPQPPPSLSIASSSPLLPSYGYAQPPPHLPAASSGPLLPHLKYTQAAPSPAPPMSASQPLPPAPAYRALDVRPDASSQPPEEGSPDPDDHDRKSAEGNYWNANEDEEDLAEYRPGGYHPVMPGELFDGTYKAIKKLGWGEFSTVWLAWDVHHSQFVALKVSKSAPDYRKASMWEVQVFERINERLGDLGEEALVPKWLNQHSPHRPPSQCVVRMHTSFDHHGPHGAHLVMVFEVLGPNLLSLISAHDFKGIQINIVKSITKQVLQGLSFIHEDIGVIHTDLKPENILMNHPSEGVAQAIAEYLGDLEAATGKRYDHLLSLKQNDLDSLSYTERLAYEYGITISDLGAARWLSREYPPAVIQTREYRSPEVILGLPKVGPPIDIWSLACVVFELITGDFLFDPKTERTIDKDVYHIALFMQVLGELPKTLTTGLGKHCPKFFTKRGEFKHQCGLQPCDLSSVFLHNYGLAEGDALELASFLLPMLEYNPARRISARDALKHPWLNIREPA